MKKIRTAKACAWVIGDRGQHLCCWAEPTKGALIAKAKPSPEAKVIGVRIIPEADYRRLMRAAKGEVT